MGAATCRGRGLNKPRRVASGTSVSQCANRSRARLLDAPVLDAVAERAASCQPSKAWGTVVVGKQELCGGHAGAVQRAGR